MDVMLCSWEGNCGSGITLITDLSGSTFGLKAHGREIHLLLRDKAHFKFFIEMNF